MEKIKNYIGGEFLEPVNGTYLENFNPATGEAYSAVPDSDSSDVKAAVEVADKAFLSWSRLSSVDRARHLRRIAQLLEGNAARLAQAETDDVGKPISLSESVDVPRAIRTFEFFADAISQQESETYITDSPYRALNYVLRQPLGTVGTITPWNLPLYLLTWKVAPALAAGNCVVAKPSEVTPMTAFLFSQICHEAGLPPGVFNLVHGGGATTGTALVNHSRIKAVSFTGSTSTGRTIARSCGENLKKVSLELGGKNPTIVFEDCNWEQALTHSVRAAFSNSGQICLCGSRIFVESRIYDRFKKELTERVRALKVGDPRNRDTQMGSVVSKAHFEKIMQYLKLARDEGGTFLTGGHAQKVSGRCEKGWFIQPTLIEGLNALCRTNQEEIFGPVATLIPFENEDDVLIEANSVPYGLSASVWTQDVTRAHRFAERLEAGVVWVNSWMIRDLRTPFGGMKSSGVGREGGHDAMRFFTEPKNVCVSL